MFRPRNSTARSHYGITRCLVLLEVLLAAGCVSTSSSGPTVVLFGDSLSVEASPYFDRLVESTGATAANYVYGGTAVCDWLPTVRNVAGARPRYAVLEFSGSTFTPCMHGLAPGSTAAIDKYTSDMEKAIGYFLGSRTRVLLVGTPITYSQWVAGDRSWDDLNRAYSALAARHRGTVTFVDGGAAVEGPGAAFTWTMPCLVTEPCTGPVVGGVRTNVVRAADGVHFCPQTNPSSGCATYSSGAFRFALSMARPIVEAARRPDAGQ